MLEMIVGVIPASSEVLGDPFGIQHNSQTEDEEETETKGKKPQHTKIITYL